MRRSSGATRWNAGSGPDTTKLSRPASTTLPLPLTGAARNETPRCAHTSRMRAEESVETVEQSTTTPGSRAGSASSPPSPRSTCSRSGGVATMVKTTSCPRRSAMESTTATPCAASGSALDLVRFQALSATPDRASRRAIANPIRPVPIQPTVSPVRSVLWSVINSTLAVAIVCINVGDRFGSVKPRRRPSEPGGEPVGGVGAVPRGDVGAAVVAVLQHEHLHFSPGLGTQPLRLLPRDQAVLPPEDDQQGGGDARRVPGQ